MEDSGQFIFPQYPFELGWTDIMKWKFLSKDPYREKKRKDNWRPKVVKDDSFLHHEKDAFVWLGHASFFFRLNGKSFLIDPVLGRLAPLMPRFSELPIKANKFNDIDYILVTHDHRDHCDASSLKFLAKQNPKAQFISGLRMGNVLSRASYENRLTEMGWMQQVEIEDAGVKITYLPTRHWCRRFLTDTNQRLWGAFILETENQTIYFGGDSGYGEHFKTTAEYFPDIDYAFLGVGAFAPIWFMQSNHMSPWAALEAFSDLGARKMIPMHYGTFDLSDEPIGEPEHILRELVNEKKLENQILFSTIGVAYDLVKVSV